MCACPAAAACVLVALKEALLGWSFQQTARPGRPRLQACGWAALAMCVGYMGTDMSGLGEVALPDNPGAVFKSDDIARKSAVWTKWGYGTASMR